MPVLLIEYHRLEVLSLQCLSERRVLQQFKHPETVREENVLAVLRFSPILQVVEVVDKGVLVEVPVLRQVCTTHTHATVRDVEIGEREGSASTHARARGESRVGRAGRGARRSAQWRYSGLASACTNSNSDSKRSFSVAIGSAYRPWKELMIY